VLRDEAVHESEGLLSNAGVFESRDAADVMSTEPERETTRRTDVPAEPDGTRRDRRHF